MVVFPRKTKMPAAFWPEPAGDAVPVVMPSAERHLLIADGGPYSIFIAWPEQPPPPEGYATIYLLDANATFATMVDAMRLQSRRPRATGVSPSVIVGIGYPIENLFDV